MFPLFFHSSRILSHGFNLLDKRNLSIPLLGSVTSNHRAMSRHRSPERDPPVGTYIEISVTYLHPEDNLQSQRGYLSAPSYSASRASSYTACDPHDYQSSDSDSYSYTEEEAPSLRLEDVPEMVRPVTSIDDSRPRRDLSYHSGHPSRSSHDGHSYRIHGSSSASHAPSASSRDHGSHISESRHEPRRRRDPSSSRELQLYGRRDVDVQEGDALSITIGDAASYPSDPRSRYFDPRDSSVGHETHYHGRYSRDDDDSDPEYDYRERRSSLTPSEPQYRQHYRCCPDRSHFPEVKCRGYQQRVGARQTANGPPFSPSDLAGASEQIRRQDEERRWEAVDRGIRLHREELGRQSEESRRREGESRRRLEENLRRAIDEEEESDRRYKEACRRIRDAEEESEIRHERYLRKQRVSYRNER